ncbi:tRNA-splicing endonuclease-like protein subunit Sen2 [Cucurbitaria berberidis CBS 394.84]|uniref:tRNA-splicing endonuclease subunit Sen2 n=1 Tax=Cucurbitaria berberidis CBS 394.84 TaxID=1168544 RepID=A0A9P4LAV9_9PLEO|nr:tRNA-splicing endonuclease-like protein subunit Sen2 [Cucurbitaria berberidis CBS 394.84]KAF1847898.1 tRNA-splicing endonuclease-like protein subunit Sen2 [Cucurbitaria berberidis CBS 394.84]
MAVATPAQASPEGAPCEIGATSQNPEKAANGAPRKPRQKRPNYHQIHANPLPLEVYPLPVFIPHNPISLVRIAIGLISHSIWPPQSHKLVHQAYYSPETQSIHITDTASIRALWEQGFWGKGSLSRSEPQWLVAEKRRQGAEASKTSAEVTQSRREERKQFKLERAKAQREAIEQQLRQEGKLDADGSLDELVENGQVSESPRGTIYTPNAGDVVTVTGDSIVFEVDKSLANTEEALSWGANGVDAVQGTEVQDLEHLQLSPEEAFFLTYVLGVLDIIKDGDLDVKEALNPYPAWYLMRLYCAHASSPVQQDKISDLHMAYQLREGLQQVCPVKSCPPTMEPDNPFLLKYVVYHHFRSLGWVVRPGVKFAVDYLLYIRGPAFTHAEFAIMIIPSYSNSWWEDNPENLTHMKEKEKEYRDWWWFHRVNRVQTQVMKTLILVYVEVPPPWDGVGRGDDLKFDVGAVLKQYSVREFVFKRWSPSRNRD